MYITVRAHDENAGLAIDGPAKSDKAPEHNLILYWVAAEIAAALCLLAVSWLGSALGNNLASDIIAGVISIAVPSGIEWFVLRIYMPGIGFLGWLFARLAGLVIGGFFALGAALKLVPAFYAGPVANGTSGSNLVGVVAALAVAGCIAYVEWYVLRQHTALHARLTWVIASAFGAALGTIIILLLGPVAGYTGPTNHTLSAQAVLFPILDGAIFGLATGPVLAEMVRKCSPDTEVILDERKVVK